MNKEIIERIKAVMKTEKISQTKLATASNKKQSAISDNLLCNSEMSILVIDGLARLSDVDLNWLFRGTNSMYKSEDSITAQAMAILICENNSLLF